MGKTVSKFRFFSRPFENYDVENRAFKVISKEKPTPAPTHPSLEKMMEEIKSDPDLMNKGRLSDEEIKNLSHVFVTSSGDNPAIVKQKLPDDRHTHDEYIYGFQEPTKIPAGKLSLRQLLELLERHVTDPEKNSAQVLAQAYNLDLQTSQNVIRYFQTFQLYMKPSGKEPGTVRRVTKLLASPFVFEDNKKKEADQMTP